MLLQYIHSVLDSFTYSDLQSHSLKVELWIKVSFGQVSTLPSTKISLSRSALHS